MSEQDPIIAVAAEIVRELEKVCQIEWGYVAGEPTPEAALATVVNILRNAKSRRLL